MRVDIFQESLKLKCGHMTLDDLITATRAFPPDTPLVFFTDDGSIEEGYHVTELKFARVSSIDCAAQTDAWSEAILQLLDGQGRNYMSTGKFAGILAQGARHIAGLGRAQLRVEFAHGNAGLQIYEPLAPKMFEGSVSLKLRPVTAQCRPAAVAKPNGTGESCCGSTMSACC